MRLLFFYAALFVHASFTRVVASTNTSFNAGGDLIITEIMADPDPPLSLPPSEYVEIFNRGNAAVDLTGWGLFDGSLKILPGVMLHPGEYAVICPASDTALFTPFGKTAGVSSLSLTNTGEKISLRDPSGIPVDSVTYSDSWYGGSFKKDGGWSIERVDNAFSCPVAANWKPSENSGGGTPGTDNSVKGITIDGESPVLLRAFCPDAYSATLVFNEAMDAASLLNLSNYYCQMPGMPNAAMITDPELKRVTLYFINEIPVNIICSISVSQLHDCAGNAIVPTSARFGRPEEISSAQPLINEILFNPREKGVDFVEIYHPGNNIIDLNRLKIASLSLETNEIDDAVNISDEEWLMFPGDYIVLTENPEIVNSEYRSTYPFKIITVDLPSMNADEGFIGITDGSTLYDQVYYHEDFHFSLLNDKKGISLEKIHPSRNGMNPGSWHSASPSSGFATPGLKNSQFTETEIINKEVTAIPEIFSPDYDGKDDLVTFEITTGKPGYISNLRIYNATGHMIYHYTVNFPVASHDHLSWDGIDDNGDLAAAGIYMAMVEVFNLEGDVKNYKLPFVLAIKN